MKRIADALKPLTTGSAATPSGKIRAHELTDPVATIEKSPTVRQERDGTAGSESQQGPKRLFAGAADSAADPGPVSTGFSSAVTEKLVVSSAMNPVTREQYRKLAATLHRAQLAHGDKVIMLTSAVAGEGKTLTVTNLALTLSHSYRRRVLLIDADLRNPMMRDIFCLPPPDALEWRDADSAVPLRQVRPRLWLMLARRRESDPIGTLTSQWMRQALDEARQTFDWVLIDTPPVGLLPDANLLAVMADGVVMVVSAGKTSYEVVAHAADAVGRERIIGVVLNRVDPRNLLGIDHYAHYFGGGQND